MSDKYSDVAVVVIAAGKGTRMESDLPKVLHTVAGKPIVHHTLEKLNQLKLGQVLVVVGYMEDQVKKTLGPTHNYISQTEQLGTGHAVLQSLPFLPSEITTVLVLNGDDSAFYKVETIESILNRHHHNKAKMTILTTIQEGSEVAGRVIRDKEGKVIGIKPKSQMTEEDYKNNHEVVCGFYVFDRGWLCEHLPKVEPDKKGEYNITGLINSAIKQASLQALKLANNQEWRSINTQKELREARNLWRQLSKKG